MQPPYAPNVVNQTVSYGGVTWKGNPGSGWTPESSGPSSTGNGGFSTSNIVDAAKQLNQFQIQQNQPAIQALGSQTSTIKDQYSQLVDSIKGNRQVSENSATLNANNEFARRGITGGGLYDKGLQDAVLPVDVAFSQQLANTNAGSINDLNSLALQIAQLQSGNAGGAVQSALGVGGLQQGAQSLANQLFLGTSSSTPANILQLAQSKYLGGQTQSAVSSLAAMFGL